MKFHKNIFTEVLHQDFSDNMAGTKYLKLILDFEFFNYGLTLKTIFCVEVGYSIFISGIFSITIKILIIQIFSVKILLMYMENYDL